MKTHHHLYGEICSFENLLLAERKAERCKRFQDAIGRFHTRLEDELLQLRRELLEKSYRPGGYREKIIHRPKRRMISAAPYRDRVVHHALCNVVMPLFERKMVFDLYSNRQGKGTHAAILRCQEFCRRFAYVLQCDIRKFFPSMDHAILKATIRRTVRCPETLWLLDRVIDGSNRQETVCNVFPGDDLAEASGRRLGLPIGNLTSQWFGGIYLSQFDHWVKERLRCPGYVRYVDDFLLFGDDMTELVAWREAVSRKLGQYRLRLNEKKSRVHPVGGGLTFLGQRIWPWRRRLCRQNVAEARRRLRWNVRQYRRQELSKDGLECRWNSWRGHATQAGAQALLSRMRKELQDVLGAAGT
jgi:retron-type reverse transcriptase